MYKNYTSPHNLATLTLLMCMNDQQQMPACHETTILQTAC